MTGSAIELLERLVRIPSPTGSEAEAVAFLRERARGDGLRVLDDPVGNFVAECGAGHRLLLFVGHVDTVPGEIPVALRDGELWGRGSVDAKGALVAAYCAALRHRHRDDLRIRIVGAVDEEGGSRGARALARDLDPAFLVNGEPSGASAVTLAYKGILRGRFQLERDRMHGSRPEPSAVEEAIAFWGMLAERYRFAARFDAIQGRLDALGTAPAAGGLADAVVARFQLRLPPGVDPETLGKELVAAGREARVEVALDEGVAAATASRRTALVAAFLAAIREPAGPGPGSGEGAGERPEEPRFKRKTGTADFNLLAERYPGVPLVAYGPGDASLDHTPYERLAVAELEAAVRVLDSVFARLAS